MNPSVAFIAFLMIVLGAASGFYPVSILGLFILIASLLAPNRPAGPRRPPVPQRTGDAPHRTPPQRVAPSSPQQVQLPPVPQSTPETIFPQTSNQGYASNMALFPSAMFPSASAAPVALQPSAQNQAPAAPEARDEVVELAALVVFLRLLSG